MEINVCDNTKTVEIWLNREETQGEPFKNLLKPIFISYKERKYIVAVYESGCGSLFEATKDLLVHNRKVIV